MTEPTPHHDDAKPVVLVIDDSRDVHRLLRARLRSENLELVSAESGAEGLLLAAQAAPSLILLDIDMPGMDGFEVLRALKEKRDTMEIPVIVLSGLQTSQDKVTAFDLGAVDYVTKPFDLGELRVRLRSAIRMYSLLRLLAQRAQIDGLTGLWNRAHFDRRWQDEHSRAARHDHAISLAMIDIDHFKSVNDGFGHPAGDDVLQGLAKVLRRELRQEDVACRYGGEEFVVIMPDTRFADAVATCERLREAVASIQWPRHPERPVTISIGVVGSDWGTQTLSAEAWVERADQNLYTAKRAGRNLVVGIPLDTSRTRLAG